MRVMFAMLMRRCWQGVQAFGLWVDDVAFARAERWKARQRRWR